MATVKLKCPACNSPISTHNRNQGKLRFSVKTVVVDLKKAMDECQIYGICKKCGTQIALPMKIHPVARQSKIKAVSKNPLSD